MGLTIDDGVSRTYYTPPPPPPQVPTGTTTPVPTVRSVQEPSYSPFVGPLAPNPAPTGPYALPQGSTLQQTASGTQAQPFDVTLSQLATAVYGTRGDPPPGWASVTDADLSARGIVDPQAWRLSTLGFNDSVDTNPQEFRAEVYTDGQGNYVLSYRGTAEGGADWDNNFTQGTGFETPDGDKFSVTAANAAVEFERVFGDNAGGDSSNLAITGHSQGGGLATVGSLASGVPAVTFDASGIHPNTWDRMGIDPQAARELAEGGQIRAYSLADDALTNVQDSWLTGLVAPDALGTQIVVAPAPQDANNMFTNYGPAEGIPNAPLVNAGVELARGPLGNFLLPGIAPLVGNVAYAGISHSPNALTAGMIANQPWQAGYENPSSLGRDLQNLLPDAAKDDYARNTHNLITDVQDVVANQFAQGDYVQGGLNIVGDLAEGFFNSTGDTVDGYADALAGTLDDNIDGWTGDALSAAAGGTGDLLEFGTDVVGQGTELLADGAGWVAQGVTDGAAAVGDFLNPFN